MKKQERVIRTWLYIGMIMVLIQVAIGGITRLTESGLSIATWEPIAGSLPPMSEDAWLQVFEDYKATPEYEKINAGFSLNDFKRIFWWEYIHRVWARLLGFVFILPFIFFVAKGWLNTWMFARLVIVFLLGAAQAVMGWVMVKSGLIDNPWVSPYRLTAHLFLALILFVYMFWITLDLEKKPGTRTESRFDYMLLWIASILVIVQIFYGGLMAGSDAARMYNTWPSMNGQLLPHGILDMKPTIRNFFENRSMLHVIHRYLAILATMSLLFYGFKARRLCSLQIRQGIDLLIVIILLQFGLGVFTIIQSSPARISIPFGALHQSFAFLLSAVLIYLHFQYKQNSRLI